MRDSIGLSVTISNLTNAKKFIRKPRHWAKGEYLTCDFTGFDHQASALGALYWIGVKVSDDNEDHKTQPDELSYLNEALWALYYDRYESVSEFNDAEETTHAHVIQLFDIAILHAERDLRFVKWAMSEPRETIAFTTIEPTSSSSEAKAKIIKTLDRLGIEVVEEIE